METQAMGEIRKLKSSRGGDPPRESTPRRLAAIVAGDIAGYSRLMQIDEEGTHLRVKRIERDLIEPSIVGHHGRLVKTTGDGFIAIFDSPVEAVRCGIVIQQNMVGRNASMPKHHWIEYRIGVNHLHFGSGQTETRIELAPGKHTLQLVLGDAKHYPFSPPIVSDKISVRIK